MKRLHRPLLLMLCLITAARAQKVVIYEEDQTNQFVGYAVWRTEPGGFRPRPKA